MLTFENPQGERFLVFYGKRPAENATTMRCLLVWLELFTSGKACFRANDKTLMIFLLENCVGYMSIRFQLICRPVRSIIIFDFIFLLTVFVSILYAAFNRFLTL